MSTRLGEFVDSDNDMRTDHKPIYDVEKPLMREAAAGEEFSGLKFSNYNHSETAHDYMNPGLWNQEIDIKPFIQDISVLKRRDELWLMIPGKLVLQATYRVEGHLHCPAIGRPHQPICHGARVTFRRQI
ncbi:hypothetical protein OIU78_003095 [Salix suchowensis]|nr:hypothetical protein OIU78_003095 [Salix suchowensis]